MSTMNTTSGLVIIDDPQTFTGTVRLQCAGDRCPETAEVNITSTPLDEVTDEVFELTEAVYGWYQGMFCATCSPDAFKADEADYQNKNQKENQL